MKTAVIYARYSSDAQTEQSIEGQLRINANLTNAQKISAFFCEQISNLDGVNIQFSSETFHSYVRVILKGPEEVVMGILNSYYSKEW